MLIFKIFEDEKELKNCLKFLKRFCNICYAWRNKEQFFTL
jgi:hypothetical protein